MFPSRSDTVVSCTYSGCPVTSDTLLNCVTRPERPLTSTLEGFPRSFRSGLLRAKLFSSDCVSFCRLPLPPCATPNSTPCVNAVPPCVSTNAPCGAYVTELFSFACVQLDGTLTCRKLVG